MSNCLIAFDNKADLVTLSGVVGAYETLLPITNLQDINPNRVSRTTSDSNSATRIQGVFASLQLLQFFGLINNNISIGATYRLRLYSDASLAVLIYDSGTVTVFPTGSKPYGTIPWGAPNWWTAVPTEDDLDRYQRNLFHHIPGALFARSFLFEAFDTSNADGYMQAGRLFLGQVFQPQQNMETGAAVQIKPRSTQVTARGGTDYYARLLSKQSFAVPFPRLEEHEARRVNELQAIVDTSGEVIFMWDGEDPTYWMGRSAFGRLAQLDPLVHPQYANYSTAFQVEGNLK